MTPLERLQSGYYNSGPVSEANPGGFADGGHVVNFPAALDDLAAVADALVLDAAAIEGAAEAATSAAASADAAQASAEDAAEIASGRTLRTGEGPPSDALGRDGDYYIDRTGWLIHGPKADDVWPAGQSVVGPPGAAVDVAVNDGLLQWRLGAEGEWQTLFALADLAGEDAAQVSLRLEAGVVQWAREGEAWADLFALADLPQGDQGLSAYEVAVANGFVGTEEAWLASLVGPEGEFDVEIALAALDAVLEA